MNKKGFTLVEILAVIVILSLIITIVTTNGFGVFNKVSKNIEIENVNSIKESINVLMLEVDNCEDDLDEDLFTYFRTSNCASLKNQAEDKCLNVPLKYLVTNGYVEGNNIRKFSDDNPGLKFKVCKMKIDNVASNDSEETTYISSEETTYISCSENCDNYNKIVKSDEYKEKYKPTKEQTKADNYAEIVLAAKEYIKDLVNRKEDVNLYYQDLLDDVYYNLLYEGFDIDINLLKSEGYYNGTCDFENKKTTYINGTCPKYDFNDDSIVSSEDRLILDSLIGYSDGEERYDKKYDLNNDGVIHAQDSNIINAFINNNCTDNCELEFAEKKVKCDEINCKECDLNADDRINQEDYNLVYQHIGDSINEENKSYDFNKDNAISVQDANIVSDCLDNEIILSLECLGNACDEFNDLNFDNLTMDNVKSKVELNLTDYDLVCDE